MEWENNSLPDIPVVLRHHWELSLILYIYLVYWETVFFLILGLNRIILICWVIPFVFWNTWLMGLLLISGNGLISLRFLKVSTWSQWTWTSAPPLCPWLGIGITVRWRMCLNGLIRELGQADSDLTVCPCTSQGHVWSEGSSSTQWGFDGFQGSLKSYYITHRFLCYLFLL